MGIFERLFGRKNGGIPAIPKSSTPLPEEQFWRIVSSSLAHSSDQGEQEEFLIDALQKLTPQEIIGFRLQTDKLLHETYTSDMWCAAYIMNGGCSDDGFEYFRNWVISRGKEVFYNAKANPDSLADHLILEQGEYDFESFWYVALEAFSEKTGKDLYEHINSDEFRYGEGNYPSLEFNWSEEDPSSRQRVCPRLFAKFEQ